MNRENLLYSTLFTLNIIFSFPSLVVLVQTISGTGITSYIALGLGILLIPLLSILIFQHLLKFRTPLFIIEYILSLLFASWGWISPNGMPFAIALIHFGFLIGLLTWIQQKLLLETQNASNFGSGSIILMIILGIWASLLIGITDSQAMGQSPITILYTITPITVGVLMVLGFVLLIQNFTKKRTVENKSLDQPTKLEIPLVKILISQYLLVIYFSIAGLFAFWSSWAYQLVLTWNISSWLSSLYIATSQFYLVLGSLVCNMDYFFAIRHNKILPELSRKD